MLKKKKSHSKYPSTHTTVLQRHNISHKDTIDTYNQTYHLSLSTKSGFVDSQSNIKAFPVTITFLSLLSLGFHVTFIPPSPHTVCLCSSSHHQGRPRSHLQPVRPWDPGLPSPASCSGSPSSLALCEGVLALGLQTGSVLTAVLSVTKPKLCLRRPGKLCPG